MGYIIDVLKKAFLKSGYTVLRGDLRGDIRDNFVTAELPAHLLVNARVCANRHDVLNLLPKGGTVVEIGVGYGDYSGHLLQALQPDTFVAIDSFGFTPGSEPWGQTRLKDGQCTHEEYYRRQFSDVIGQGKMEIRKGLSWEMISGLPDSSVDYAYVDADHTYTSLVKDIEALTPKMKPRGLIQFDDYTFFDQNGLMPFGVPKAVNEFMIREQYEMLYFCLHVQGFYNVVVRKLPQ